MSDNVSYSVRMRYFGPVRCCIINLAEDKSWTLLTKYSKLVEFYSLSR
jgi:hypothetical protein